MTLEQARQLLQDRHQITTNAELIEAINALGETKEEIRENLIELGFAEGNQRNCYDCPVARYLNSLGISSPYVDCSTIGDRFNEELQAFLRGNSAMKSFQRYAANGEVPGLGGFEAEEEGLTEEEELEKWVCSSR